MYIQEHILFKRLLHKQENIVLIDQPLIVKKMINKTYRPDIDGLRAISILFVVFFHFFPAYITGGFIGVDIFFVISGYLITGILLDSLKNNKFSLLDFYKRRALRIFPALSLVFIVFLVFGWGCLFPNEFKALGKHVLGGALFISNIILWREAGYFDAAAELKPFLNLWSLGIEEQFYIVWPLLLAFLWKRKFNITYLLSFIILSSFGLNVLFIKHHQAVFYLPVTRIWELGIGALLSVLIYNHSTLLSQCAEKLKTYIALLAVGLIIFAAFYLNKHFPYPSYWGLFPTIGAFLLIASGPNTWVHRTILSHPFFVGIGLISYPLYLWHWPMISFAHVLNPDGVSVLNKVILLATSILLSIGTYYLIERPIRFGGKKSLKSVVLTLFMAFIGIIGFSTYKAFLKSYNQSDLENARKDWTYPGKGISFLFNNRVIYIYKSKIERTTIYFGDSNIEQYGPRIEKILSESPEKYNSAVFYASGGCRPIPQVKEDKHPNCKNFVRDFKAYVESNQNIDTVVIGASWGFLTAFSYYYKDQGKKYPLGGHGYGYNQAIKALGEMIAELKTKRKKVYLVLNIPSGYAIDPSAIIKRYNFFWDLIIKEQDNNRKYWATQEEVTDYLRTCTQDLIKVGMENGAEIINPVDFLCDGEKCHLVNEEGRPLYKDRSHLSASGARSDAKFIDKTLIINELIKR